MSLQLNRILILVLLTCRSVCADYPDDISDLCVQADAPKTCMESYGYRCHRGETPGKSLGAYFIGCNLTMTEGQNHFVQMLNTGGEWSLEVQRVSKPETTTMADLMEDPGYVLSQHILSAMSGYNVTGNGSASAQNLTSLVDFATGARKDGDVVTVRSLCGVYVDHVGDQDATQAVRAACEKELLYAIRIRGQLSAESPYRAGGAKDISWNTTSVTLLGDKLVLIVDGRYQHKPPSRPCRWVTGCCPREGALYLDSCRAPTESELEVIESCLSQDLVFRSDAYFECLRENDVRIGCEDQKDGSRRCY